MDDGFDSEGTSKDTGSQRLCPLTHSSPAHDIDLLKRKSLDNPCSQAIAKWLLPLGMNTNRKGGGEDACAEQGVMQPLRRMVAMIASGARRMQSCRIRENGVDVCCFAG